MIRAELLFLVPFVVVYGFWWLSWTVLRWYLFTRKSGIPEIEKLPSEAPRAAGEKLKGTAVVCGGSIAGLFVARVCHDFYERVIIIEPEGWLNTEDGMRRFDWEQEHKRTRVMQYHSLHGFQVLLYQGLKKLFPDLEEQCEYSGLPILPADHKANFGGTPVPLPVTSYGGKLPEVIECNRGGMETLIRRLVLGRGSYPRIEQITGTVTGIVPDPDVASRISKVTFRKTTDLQLQELDAALVIDCTGPTRAGFKWLSQSDYGTAESYPAGRLPLQDLKISFDQKLSYSTWYLKVPPSILQKLPYPGDLERSAWLYTCGEEQTDQGRRIFGLLKLDGNRIGLIGGLCTDDNVQYRSFDDFRSLLHNMILYKDPIPEWIFQTLDMLEDSRVETLSQSHVRIPGTTYIRYHHAINIPSNFIASGDSLMTVDPVYGQGCTKALMGAVVLHKILSEQGPKETRVSQNFSERFFKEHFEKNDTFWQITRLIDYGIPYTIPLPGEDLCSGEFMRKFMRRVQILALTDEQAARVLYDGVMGLGTAVDALHPWLVIKLLWSMVIGL